MRSTPTTYLVQGRELTLPLTIARATSGLGVFTARADRVAERLPKELAPIALPGGRALVVLMLVDYLDNPLGDYDEGVVGFAARPVGRRGLGSFGQAGMWVEHMPVSQAFTREAGEAIWGYPKTLDTLSIEREGEEATLRWSREGEPILRLTVRAGGWLPAPPTRGSTYTQKEGVVHRTPLTTRASGVRVGLRGARVELGSHPLARSLAELDLSERALSSVWMERASMRFGPARPMS